MRASVCFHVLLGFFFVVVFFFLMLDGVHVYAIRGRPTKTNVLRDKLIHDSWSRNERERGNKSCSHGCGEEGIIQELETWTT